MKPMLIATLTAATLAACAPATRVILLPQADRETALRVSTGRDRQQLSGPYAEADVSSGGYINVGKANAAWVASSYRALMAAQPRPAVPIAMHFEQGSSALTEQSEKELDAALTRAAEHDGATLVITPPAPSLAPDRIGNTLLGARVQAVRTYLIAHGFAPERIRIAPSAKPGGAGPDAPMPPGPAAVTVQVR